MVSDNPIYCKFEYSESVESKKKLLSSEVSILNLLKIAKRYSALRSEELKVKAQIFKKLKETEISLNKSRAAFPFIKIPKKVKHSNLQTLQKVEKSFPAEHVESDIELQLQEIQTRLKALE